MSDATSSNQVSHRQREQAISALAPFFFDGPGSDENEARLMAEGLLDDYHAATPKELQLATQIAASGMAVLACLRTAAAVKNLTLEQKLDFQESAIALNRLSDKANKALEASRKQRAKNPAGMTPENTKWDEGAFQKAINKALEKLSDANATFAAYTADLSTFTEASAAATPAIKAPETVAPAVHAMEAATPKPKLPILSAQPMTPAVLARRAKH